MTVTTPLRAKIKELIRKRDVRALIKFLWGNKILACQTPTPNQVDIVRIIAFEEHQRLGISCMTRYGKTQFIAVGLALKLLIRRNHKIRFIAPQSEQCDVLRDYMSELIVYCRGGLLIDLAHLEHRGSDRLLKEASKRRQTFKNGSEYRIFSAHGKAYRLMGWGTGSDGGTVVVDEAALVSKSAYTKIMRMLGDAPDKTVLIESMNPWDMATQAYKNWSKAKTHQIHVGWKTALAEGRTTQAFIDEMREDMSDMEFEVLYESKFPDEAEDSVFKLSSIIKAENNTTINLPGEAAELMSKLDETKKKSETDYKRLVEALKEFRFVISCDVADMGKDETVIYDGMRKLNTYQISGYFSEKKSDNMEIANRMYGKAKKLIEFPIVPIELRVDNIGYGAGVVSRLRELLRPYLKSGRVRVIGCHFGQKAVNSERFSNKKAENYWAARKLLSQGQVRMPKTPKLREQLLAMKWKKMTDSRKIKIIDPKDQPESKLDISPDWADALVYFIWDDKTAMHFGFL